MDYTLDQLEVYLNMAQRRVKEAMRWQLIAPALGFAGGEGLKKALKALE